ncbi:insulinase family protein [candidate division WWE3 bacterium]|uniref:Insulinase family protein n=1 Tax=candidate division WWE3 bacterium TaxID=2053526 RepID=A0A7X9HSN0_UNCKA|nr:insulinase family protein [candidate division WWE3 bacterium]
MKKLITLQDFQVTLQNRNEKGMIKFVHFKRSNSPISIKVCSRSGSRFDPEGKEGLAHFVEHIVLSGTEKFPSKRELSLAIYNIGGSYSATTATEYTCFNFLIAKKEHIPLVGEITHQILEKPTLSEEKIEREKKVVQDEISERMDNKKRLLANGIRSLIYGDNPLARNVSGYKKSVESISKRDIDKHLKEVTPNNTTIISCGDCDIEELIRSFDSSVPCKEYISNSYKVSSYQTVRYGSTEVPGQKLVHCSLAFPTCNLGSKDVLALKLLTTYLGEGRASLLKNTLRYQNNLLYSVLAKSNYFSDSGYLSIEATTKKENLNQVINIITETLNDLLQNGVKDEDLFVIKNKIINSSIISTQTAQSWVGGHFYRQLLIKSDNYYFNDFLNDVSNIDTKTINKVAQKYLTKDNMYLYAVGNIKTKEIKDLLT